MNKIRVGIIGAGYIATVHGDILASDERVELIAIHDIIPENAARLASNYNAQCFQSATELIDQSDAVYITTPNTKHVPLALAAVKAGKHVFCEKPLATNVADAQSIFRAVDQSNIVFQVGHNRRFAPVYVKLKKLISDTHNPHSAHVKMNRGELLQPVWTGDPTITGGFLFETTIHMFDMMRFLFGEVHTLHAIGSTHEYNEVDDFSVLLRFTSGMHATLASSADATWLFPFERVEVFCHHATIITREMESLSCSTNLEGHYTTESMQQLPREVKWGYKQEDRAFIDAIFNKTPPPVTVLDGLRSVELVEAIYKSVESGVPVEITQR